MQNIAGRLIKGSAWLSISRAVVNGLAAISTIVLARYLSPSDFGLVALGTTMLAIVSTVTELSLGAALVRHPAPDDGHLNAVWTASAIRGLVLGGLFAVAAQPVAYLYQEPRLTGVMWALGLSVFLSGLGNPRMAMLQRSLIFHQDFILSVAQKLAGVIASVTIAVIFQSYWALVVGVLLTQVTNVVGSYLILPFRPSVSFRHLRELLTFSIWLTAGRLVDTINWRADYLLTGAILGRAELGHYSVGSNLAMTPTRETTAPLTRTIFPAFAALQNDSRRLATGYQRVQALVTAVALPAGVGAALVADPLIRLTMGEKWIPAIFIVQALASVYALQTLGTLAQPLGMAVGETRRLFIRSTQMMVFRLPIIIGGMLLFGLTGLVLSRVFTGLVGIFVNMRLVRRFADVTILEQLRANIRALISVAVMALGTGFVSHAMATVRETSALILQLGVTIGVGASLYVGTTILLWLLMKKPDGPETEVQRIAEKLLSRLRRGA